MQKKVDRHKEMAVAIRSYGMRQLYAFIFVLVSLSFLGGCGCMTGGDSGSSAYGEQALRAASSQVGKPYCYGGASPKKGFDCSGLVYWSYARTGVKIPRRTTDQLQAGESVALNDRLPGDIVVFRIRGNNLHTGLYAGKNTFIHSPRQGSNVRKDSLQSPYWSKRLVAIRRIN